MPKYRPPTTPGLCLALVPADRLDGWPVLARSPPICRKGEALLPPGLATLQPGGKAVAEHIADQTTVLRGRLAEWDVINDSS